jgi:hypothetical protein
MVAPIKTTSTTNTTSNTGSTPAISWDAAAAAAASTNLYANMKTYTNTTSTTQTSQPDITAVINATMQQLVGRNATAAEIAQYGQELLAAEAANPGKFQETTSYGPTGKRADITGSQVSSGVDPTSFISNIVRGTAEASQYNIMNTYMGALSNLADSYKGSFNG